MTPMLHFWYSVVAILFGLSTATLAEDMNSPAPSERKPADAVVGFWRIDFTPNRAVRNYEIRNDGTVVDAVGSKGTLKTANMPPGKGDSPLDKGQCVTQHFADWRNGTRWHLQFEEDSTGCFELITPSADGRLIVEHFNPSATALPLPDQIGIGERDEVKRPGQSPLISPDGPVTATPRFRDIALEELPPGAIDGFGDTRLRHAAPVTSVAVSPDGKWIASGSLMGEQRLWDAETGKLLRTFKDAYGTKVSLIAFSPDGLSLAMLKGHLNCWDPVTGEKKFQFEVEGFPVDMCFSPDGRTLAVAAKNTDNVVLYDAKTGLVRERIGGHHINAVSVAYSPNGRYLASIDESSTLFLRDLETGATVNSAQVYGKMTFSPDSARIAVPNGQTMSLYKIDGMSVIAPAEHSIQEGLYADTTPRTARFSADGQRISWGNSIWDVATGKKLVEHNGMMNGPAEWFPKGDRLAASGADGLVRVIDARSGETLLPAHETARVFNLLPDTASPRFENSWPRLGHLDVQLFSTNRNIPELFSDSTERLAFVRTHDSGLIVFGTRKSRLPSSGIMRETRYDFSMELKAPFSDFQLTRNASQIVVQVEDRLEVWRVGHKDPRFVLHEFDQYDAQQPEKPYQVLSQFEVSPDGLEVAALINENLIIQADPETDRKEAALRQIFKVWTLETGEETLSLIGPVRRVNEPTMSKFYYAHDSIWHPNPDGSFPKFLATGTTTLDDPAAEPNARLFKLISGTQSPRQFSEIRLVSPDDKWMLTETFGKDRIPTERTVRDIKQPENPILWNPEGNQFAVSHNGQWLACCTWKWDEPAGIEIRNAATGIVLTSFKGHLGPVHSMSFSTDDRTLATAGGDGSTLIWDLTTFGGHTPDAITSDDGLLTHWMHFIGDDSPKQYRSMWRYVLDDRLMADFQARLQTQLTTGDGQSSETDHDRLIQRVITLFELRADADSTRRIKEFADDENISPETRSLARQSVARISSSSLQGFGDEGMRPTDDFRAYWIIQPDHSQAGYRKLLITRGPVEQLLQSRLSGNVTLGGPASRSVLPFDQRAFTFETFEDDSLWSRPFETVESFGSMNISQNQIVVNEQTFEISNCSIQEVIRLMENPMGTKPLHRMHHPLLAAENTAKAFALLLKEQQASE